MRTPRFTQPTLSAPLLAPGRPITLRERPERSRRMKDRKLEKLIRKVSGAPLQKTKKERFVDPTLQATKSPPKETDEDTKFLFKEMKRREF